MTPNLSLNDPAFVGILAPEVPVVYGTITANGDEGDNDRVQKALGFTLSDSLWVCEFEIESTSGGAFMMPVCFSENTGVVAETGAENDAMGFYLDDNWNSFQRLGNPPTFAPTGWIAGTDNSPRYITMARQTSTTWQIDIYTDSARTTHDPIICGYSCTGYSGIMNITVDSAVDNLDIIQSSCRQSSGGVTQAYTVTDIKVWNSTNDTSGTIDFNGIATGWTQIGTIVTIA